jgi:hypothetical protein
MSLALSKDYQLETRMLLQVAQTLGGLPQHEALYALVHAFYRQFGDLVTVVWAPMPHHHQATLMLHHQATLIQKEPTTLFLPPPLPAPLPAPTVVVKLEHAKQPELPSSNEKNMSGHHLEKDATPPTTNAILNNTAVFRRRQFCEKTNCQCEGIHGLPDQHQQKYYESNGTTTTGKMGSQICVFHCLTGGCRFRAKCHYRHLQNYNELQPQNFEAMLSRKLSIGFSRPRPS